MSMPPALEAFRRQLPVGEREPPWLARMREEALSHFLTRGLPDPRQEEWRHTRLDAIADTAFSRAEPAAAADVTHEALGGHFLFETSVTRLVLVNGRLVTTLSSQPSLPRGVRVQGLAAALAAQPELLKEHFGRRTGLRENPFLALNSALFEDGVLVHLQPGVRLGHPLHLMFVSNDGGDAVPASHPRVLVMAGPRSHATIVETHLGIGSGPYLSNALTEILAGPDASIEYYKVQEESPDAYHMGQLDLRLGRGSRVTAQSFTFGAALARNEIRVAFQGQGAECRLDGLYVLSDRQHCDTQTLIDHALPECASSQCFHGILDDHARGVFSGRVLVRPDAQRSSARQTNKNLLLSDSARADAKPQLEIHADDVQCSHGVAIGQLDADAVFYLRSRGLGEAEARAVLTRAFAGAVTERILVPALRCRIDLMLAARLGGGLAVDPADPPLLEVA